MSIFGKVSNFIRINFVGRPLELNRLVFDDTCLIQSTEEANNVMRGYWKYYGFQYFGNSIAFINLSLLIKFKKSKINFLYFVIVPMAGFYIYSHFTYWDIVRPIVIETRKRDKQNLQISEDENKLKFNTSVDLHEYIRKNIGTFKCLIGLFK
jgi:hypothetical protein